MNLCLCGVPINSNERECARCRTLRMFDLEHGATDEDIKKAYRCFAKA